MKGEAMEVRDASAGYALQVDIPAVPEGYKQTEVGVIPEDWCIAQLKDLVEFLDSQRRPVKSSERAKMAGIYPYYGASGIVDYVNGYLFDEELILLGEDGENILSRNLPLAFKVSGKIWVNNHAHVLKPNRRTDIGFLTEFLEAQDYSERNSGTAQPKLNRATCAKIPVAVPAIQEQRAIATTLSDVDALLEALDRLIAKKRAIKQAAMQQLLTGQTRLPGFEGGWETRSLMEIAENKKALFNDGDWVEAEHIAGEGVRLVQTGNIGVGQFVEKETQKYIYEASFEKLKCKELKVGDILICRLAEPAGRACIMPDIGESRVITSVDVTIFRPRFEMVDRNFLVQFFSTSDWFKMVQDRVGGTTHKRISRGALGKLRVPFPRVEEQRAIARIFIDMDAELDALEQHRAKTTILKQGMMQQLLTGRIRLVKPKTLTENTETKPTKAKGHNWQINEAVVISVLAKRFGSTQYPLSRKRYTKLSYLLHRRAEKEAEGYLKKAAGPYNPRTRYGGPEKIALENNYIHEHSNGVYKGFVAADNVSQAENYFEQWYGSEFGQWLEQFRYRRSDELEVLTTVDMAAQGLRDKGKVVNLKNVKGVIQSHPEWKAKLARPCFSDAYVREAIRESETLFWDDEFQK